MKKASEYKFEVSLPVSILKENKYFVAYTPALDLSTSGKTFEETKERFDQVVKIFFEELTEKGTLDKVLTDLGWQKKQKQWSPPVVVSYQTKMVQVPLSV